MTSCLNNNPAWNKSKDFAVRIVKLYKYLNDNEREFVISKQILRCGTSIGANISEAQQGFSKPDFIYKFQIALKEAAETSYWLEILHRSEYIGSTQYDSMRKDCDELMALITSILKSAKAN